MKTFAATLTVILRPGVARDASEADIILRRILDEHPEILGGQYVKINGELRSPHELEIDLPASPPPPGRQGPHAPHRAGASPKPHRRKLTPAQGARSSGRGGSRAGS